MIFGPGGGLFAQDYQWACDAATAGELGQIVVALVNPGVSDDPMDLEVTSPTPP